MGGDGELAAEQIEGDRPGRGRDKGALGTGHAGHARRGNQGTAGRGPQELAAGEGPLPEVGMTSVAGWVRRWDEAGWASGRELTVEHGLACASEHGRLLSEFPSKSMNPQ